MFISFCFIPVILAKLAKSNLMITLSKECKYFILETLIYSKWNKRNYILHHIVCLMSHTVIEYVIREIIKDLLLVVLFVYLKTKCKQLWRNDYYFFL